MSALTAGTRRWPLLVIGASAGVAIWSGWVGLGGLTGFGVVKPLPGISDAEINTAIALPIGVEAYAAYALAVATSNTLLSGGARRFAWRSAWGALGLGMIGQTAFHLMVEAGITTAPWWITTLVSCMPVAVLGMAAYLWHLTARADGSHAHPVEDPIGWVDGSDPIEEPSTQSAIQSDGSDGSMPDRMDGSEPIGSDAEPDGSDRVVSIHAVADRLADRMDGSAVASPRPNDVAQAREAIKRGDLTKPLSADAVAKTLKIGLAKARAVRDAINAEPNDEPAEA